MITKHVPLTLAALAVAIGALSGCSKTEPAVTDTEAAKPEAAPSKPAAPASSGNVIVAPVSKVASAPGIDPMKASTLPPMPAAARASAPATPLVGEKK